jgi:predicted flap endonuclease-1-like 5' DNA nuclease
MELKEALRKLDETILFADFQTALNTFFSKKIKTVYKDHQVDGLKAKRDYLERFFKEVSAVKEITLHKQYLQKPETFSLFTFSFEMYSGNTVSWFEVIRRKWKNGKVVEEEFWIDPGQQVLDLLEKNASKEVLPKKKKAAKKPAVKKEKADKKIKSTATGTAITAIKGVGPKSAAVFKKEGLESVEQLAKMSIADLEALVAKLNWNSPYLEPAYLKKEAEKILQS